MFNKFKRLGTVTLKVQITVDLKELTLLDPIDGITLLCLELKRGKSTILSSNKLWPDEESTSIIDFDEELKVIVTAYKDSNGKYCEKKGRLNLYGNRRTDLSATLLGFVDLNLLLLECGDTIQNSKLEFTDTKGKKIGLLDVSLSLKVFNDGNEVDSSIERFHSSEERNVPYDKVYLKNTDKCLSPDVSVKSTHGLRLAMASYREPGSQKRRSCDGIYVSSSSPSHESYESGAGEETKGIVESELHIKLNPEDYREICDGLSPLNRTENDMKSSVDRNMDIMEAKYAEEQKIEISDIDKDTSNYDVANVNKSNSAETYAELEKAMLLKLSIMEVNLQIANAKTHELEKSMHTQIDVMNENLKVANENINNLENDQVNITSSYAGEVVDLEKKTKVLSKEIQLLTSEIIETKGELGRLNMETLILSEKLIEKDEKIDFFELQLDERNGHILSLSKRITSVLNPDRINYVDGRDIITIPVRSSRGPSPLCVGGEIVSYQQLMEKNEMLEKRIQISENLASEAESELANIISKYSIERERNQREIDDARIKEEKYDLIKIQAMTEIDNLRRSEELHKIENKELKNDLLDTFHTNDESRREEMKKYLNLKSFVSRVNSRLTPKEKSELDELDLENTAGPVSPFSFGSILCFM